VRVEQKSSRARLRNTTDAHVSSLDDWIEHHQDYVRYYCNEDGINVLCIQSSFMATLALRDVVNKYAHPEELELKLEERITGHVTDAAHGFWQDSDSILIVTSCYTKTLLCWVPILISYANGQTADHYRRHFRVLFDSIRDNAESYDKKDGIEFSYILFAGVRPFQVLCSLN
jgi:hypothetical protein